MLSFHVALPIYLIFTLSLHSKAEPALIVLPIGLLRFRACRHLEVTSHAFCAEIPVVPDHGPGRHCIDRLLVGRQRPSVAARFLRFDRARARGGIYHRAARCTHYLRMAQSGTGRSDENPTEYQSLI